MSPAEVVCCKQFSYITEANSMDPEQTAPMKQSDLGPHCLSIEAS